MLHAAFLPCTAAKTNYTCVRECFFYKQLLQLIFIIRFYFSQLQLLFCCFSGHWQSSLLLFSQRGIWFSFFFVLLVKLHKIWLRSIQLVKVAVCLFCFLFVLKWIRISIVGILQHITAIKFIKMFLFFSWHFDCCKHLLSMAGSPRLIYYSMIWISFAAITPIALSSCCAIQN